MTIANTDDIHRGGPEWPPASPAALQPPATEVRADSVAYAIEIEGMHKSYGRTHAVNDLSLHVPVGSIYGFVGPNGAGKTTTIRTLATLQKPDAGEIRVAGIDLRRSSGEVRDRVGYMPDFFGVYESLTVIEYLDFYGASHRIPVARRRQLCAELLELVDLSEKRNDPVEVLSRGMKQRLGLARCLVHDPEVLLLDEPASGMDPRARIELREILRELGRMNKTILISSHILPELAEMCTHVGIIRAGQLLAEGPVDGVIAALSANSKLRIRLLHPASQAEAMHLLEARASTEGSPLQDIETENDRTLVVAFTGDESDLASLLVEFVRAGVPITSFSREEGTLEDVFLQVSGLGEAD